MYTRHLQGHTLLNVRTEYSNTNVSVTHTLLNVRTKYSNTNVSVTM